MLPCGWVCLKDVCQCHNYMKRVGCKVIYDGAISGTGDVGFGEGMRMFHCRTIKQ